MCLLNSKVATREEEEEEEEVNQDLSRREIIPELKDLMRKNDNDVCATNHTVLNGSECVEICDKYKLIGTNRDCVSRKTGGESFIIVARYGM